MSDKTIHQLQFDVKKYGAAARENNAFLNVFEDGVFVIETFEFNN